MTNDTGRVPADGDRIDAGPTKELFIDMLTRDISLSAAIIDLVDNSTDGAQRVRGDEDFEGQWARIEVGANEFRISDNCGGIPVDTARRYAFRFGRPHGTPFLKHSIGQFGVGMKRAMFKMGRAFRVESATATERFAVEEDVTAWAANPEWEFRFSHVETELEVPIDDRGTTITVTNLHPDVAESFALENFVRQLQTELRTRLRVPIARGLAVTLNGIPVDADPVSFLSDERLAPAFRQQTYERVPGEQVNVKLYCGLGPSADAAAAGWHVFCNGRLVLEADKSSVTGWGSQNGTRIPAFHPQYNHFRGYAYFDSDNAGLLPWNTTKTGLNPDAPVQRAVRLDMRSLMRPVIDFLNSLAAEKKRKEGDDSEDAGPLEGLVEGSEAQPAASITTREAFIAPTMPRPPARPAVANIKYRKPKAEVEAVKRLLRVRTYREVGEKTFEYFYESEVTE